MLFQSKPVHSLMLSSHRFLCQPLRLPPCTVPCRIVFASPDDLVTCPYHFSLRLFTEVRRSPYTSDCKGEVCLFVGCLTPQKQASVSQGRIFSDNFTCCHTEIEVADQTFYLTQSQYTDTRPTSPSADPRTPGAWQGSHWSASL